MAESGETYTANKKEEGPAFEPFIAVPTREKWPLLKKELFAAKELKELEKLKEQPHGLDLLAAHFVEINPNTGRPGKIIEAREPERSGGATGVIRLKPGKEYFAMLWPPLRESNDQCGYILHLFPRSSLLRAGVAAQESFFYNSADNAAEDLARWFPYYYDGRQAAFRIFVANPNGVEIENLAPLVQIVPERLPVDKGAAAKIAKTQEAFAREREQEKRIVLHVGEAREFKNIRPRIAQENKNSTLDVTVPLEAINGALQLHSGTPYIITTKEEITMARHEIGITRIAEEKGDIAAFGDALVDAGYRGTLTYLAVPRKNISLRAGEPFSFLMKIHVPTTERPYRGQWKQ